MDIATINENTPFRFIVRKGKISELSQCILAEGELGYTTDTKRLYVGDGVTKGGNPINNIVKQQSGGTLITPPISSSIAGDIVYNNFQMKIYTGLGNLWNTYVIQERNI